MALLDDINRRARDRKAALNREVERILADSERLKEHDRTKLAMYRPLVEEFAKESGWTIEQSGSFVSLTGKGLYECRCSINVQTVQIQGWIWDRHVLRTYVSAGWTVGRYVETLRSKPRWS